ncbi:MAG TPA: hypothetical protein ENI25_01115 [Epsilonproteobacteria bacterium]|nr:hypothetical protein [Campylobacterota bacterium]
MEQSEYTYVVSSLKNSKAVIENAKNMILSVLEVYKSAADILNRSLADEISSRFNVDCRFEACIDRDTIVPELKMYVIAKEAYEDINEAYDKETKLWEALDEFMVKYYPKLYQLVCMLVMVRWKEDER